MAPLPHRNLRHQWLRYQTEEYTIGIVHDFECRLKTIWDILVNRVHILDFEGLTPEIRQDLAVRLRMVYTGEDGQQVFVSHAWRRMSDIKMGLDVADTLCFQLGGVRRSMTWRQFILALGPHTEQEMAQARDPVRRLCYRMIVCTIYGCGQGPDKVTGVDLFYLRTMDQGTANVSYLLTRYLFRHAEGRKSEARLSGGHFIGRLVEHFGLVSDEGLRGLTIISQELPVIDLHELARLNICGRRLRHIHSSLSPRLCRKGSRGLRKRCVIYGKVLLAYEEWLRALLPSRLGSPPGWETLAESTKETPQFGPERPRVYSDLNSNERDRYNADIQTTNILLQGLPKDIYTLINHYTDAKDIWDNVKMLLEESELTKEDRESQLYDNFEHFKLHKEESINDYYVRFSKLINDMRNNKMTMPKLQLNSKFMNNMLPEWGRFVTAVKLNRGLRKSNYDQLFAYLKQHEAHAKEKKMVLERLSQPIAQPTADPLALLSNVSNTQHGSPSSLTSSITLVTPPRANSTDDLIENLTSTLALLTQSYRTFLPQTNNQL
nr:hypothetical protein [Tanacetum cinerariifolium]